MNGAPATKTILLISGAAPYLGGPETWRRLRAAAPEFAYTELDPLDSARAPDIAEALRQRVCEAAHGAAAIVAHGTSASIAIEALARGYVDVPLLLLSPIVVTRDTWPARLTRFLANTLAGRLLLATVGRSKLKRLQNDDAVLRKKLATIVAADSLTEALLHEARARISGPLTELAVLRTGEVLAAALRPVALPAGAHIETLFGEGEIDKKMSRRIPAQIIAGIQGAPMLEAPDRVAQTLRAMLGSLDGLVNVRS